MWKYIFRGVRESFGRCGERAVGSACETNTTNFTTRPGKEGTKCNDPNTESESTHNTSGRIASESLCSQNFLKGVGLSTVVWLTQFARDWHHWRRHTPSESFYLPERGEKHKCRYKCLLQILAGVAKAQPKLPQGASNDVECVSVGSTDREISFGSEDSSSVGSILSSVGSEEFEFKSSKELEEARNGLGEISSNIENVLGVYYHDHSQPDQAIQNFKRAWSRGNVKACYNLGLCYELGVGTQPDPRKAVEYYKKAASLGHVQASYNLGVYYAQGRGGLPKDPSRAHQLFQHAAEKGLLQAKAAIGVVEATETAFPLASGGLLPVAVGT